MLSGHEERSIELSWEIYGQFLVDARRQIYQALIKAFSENQLHTETQTRQDQVNVLSEFKSILDEFSFAENGSHIDQVEHDSFDLIDKAYLDLIKSFDKTYKSICYKLCNYPVDLLSQEKQGICLFFIKISRFIDQQFYFAEKIKQLPISEFIQKEKKYTDFLKLSFEFLDALKGLKMQEDAGYLSQALYDLEQQLYRKNYIVTTHFPKVELSYENTIRTSLSSFLQSLEDQVEISRIIHARDHNQDKSVEHYEAKASLQAIKINLGLKLREILFAAKDKTQAFSRFEEQQIESLNSNEKYISQFLEVLGLINQAKVAVEVFFNDAESNGVNAIDYWVGVIKGKSKTEKIPLANIDKGWGAAGEVIHSQLFDYIKFSFDALIANYGDSLNKSDKIEKRIDLVRQNYTQRKIEAEMLQQEVNKAVDFYDNQLAPSIQSTLKRLDYTELKFSKLKSYWYLILPPAALVGVGAFVGLFFLSALSVASIAIVATCAVAGVAAIGFLSVYYKLSAVYKRFPKAKKLMNLDESDQEINSLDLGDDIFDDTPDPLAQGEDDFVLISSPKDDSLVIDQKDDQVESVEEVSGPSLAFFGFFSKGAAASHEKNATLSAPSLGSK